jgi:putative membrane protein
MAMILPGISGSFILLLLGVYLTVMETISAFTEALSVADTEILFTAGIKLLVFIAGCVTGLLLFARLLKWMFKRAHDLTVAVLTGFLIGSLNKVWPWKKVVSTFVKHEGTEKEKIVPLVERNISPLTYSEFTGEPSFLTAAVIAAIVGFLIVFILHRLSPEQSK